MKRMFFAGSLIFISSCLYSVPLPSSPDGGASDAGTAVVEIDAGTTPTPTPTPATDAGTPSNGDGGVVLPSVPLINTLAPLDPAKCGKAHDLLSALRPTCAGDVCLSWLRKGNPAVTFTLPGVSRAAFYNTRRNPGAGGAAAVVWTSSAGPQSSMHLVDSTGFVSTIESAGTVWQDGIVLDSTGLWYLRLQSSGNVLKAWSPATGLLSMGTLSSSNFFDATVVTGGNYIFADSNGISEASFFGGVLLEKRIVNLPSTSKLRSFDAEGDDVYFTDCASSFPIRPCLLKRYQRSTQILTTVMDQTVQLLDSAKVVLEFNHVYVLDALRLLRIPRTGGGIETVYAGEPFPQYKGTLRASSLEVFNDKLYFGQVCEFDADAPTYAAVEVDLPTLAARYLENDPDYPLVPKLEGRVGDIPLSSYVQPREEGLFIIGK